MGCQSFMIGYNSKEEETHILRTIAHHNFQEKCEKVGQPLEMVCKCEITKPYQTGVLKDLPKAILCLNLGGRWDTYDYFKKNSLSCAGFETRHRERLNAEKAWEYVPQKNLKNYLVKTNTETA